MATCLLEAVFPKTVSKANLTFMLPTPSCTPMVCSSVAPHISLSPLDLSRSLQVVQMLTLSCSLTTQVLTLEAAAGPVFAKVFVHE